MTKSKLPGFSYCIKCHALIGKGMTNTICCDCERKHDKIYALASDIYSRMCFHNEATAKYVYPAIPETWKLAKEFCKFAEDEKFKSNEEELENVKE